MTAAFYKKTNPQEFSRGFAWLILGVLDLTVWEDPAREVSVFGLAVEFDDEVGVHIEWDLI